MSYEHEQHLTTENSLDHCWERLSELKGLIDGVDMSRVSAHERNQIQEMLRITGAYAFFVIETGAISKGEEPIHQKGLSEVRLLIDLHCDDSIICLNNLLDEQAGLALKGVRAA